MTERPDVGELPLFAKDFKVELLAERPDGNVLVSVKTDPGEIEKDTSLADLAELVGKQPGWRYDITLLKPPEAPESLWRGNADELSEAQIEKMLGDAGLLFERGFEPQAFLTAWAAFESTMRHRLRAIGHRAGYGSPARTMLNELISSGEIDSSEFRDLEGISKLRNVIVHGFESPPIGISSIEFLGMLSRRFLNDVEEPT